MENEGKPRKRYGKEGKREVETRGGRLGVEGEEAGARHFNHCKDLCRRILPR